MIVVADFSPLIVLSKLNAFELLPKLYPRILITHEVYSEVVVAGAGLPGASRVAAAAWIEVKLIQNSVQPISQVSKFGLAAGELSTILLARELKAELILMDDLRARRLAKSEGLEIRGSVGVLELLHRLGYISDLRFVFQQLLTHSVYIDRDLLNRRLQAFGLATL